MFGIKHITAGIVVILLNISPVIAGVDDPVEPLELPASFDWRDINGTDFTTPIKNQAPAPTCEAYALCASLETLVQYEVGHPFDVDLSEAHLFFYAGGTANWGVDLVNAVEYLMDYGVPDEGCYPDPHRQYDPSTLDSLPGWENRTVKITSYGWVDSEEINDIKQALIDHGPLIICILNRNDFLRYRGGIYSPWNNRFSGGHVLNIVGYDDAEECWIIRNSAGEDWGEDGYARVSYSAHSPKHPFFWDFYGPTAILWIDGTYGNFMPDVPQVYIESPKMWHTYIHGYEFSTIFQQISWIQRGVSRILGSIPIQVSATNTNRVEFYLDGDLQFTDENEPYEWELDTSQGLHTIEVCAYNEHNMSKDILDLYVFK